ncbi:GTP 3',8-cyclase MoaA [Granulosicoccus antarcticus]|uniref:GTP 3',8-cyclase n=1 Tax=Granulosicoccus antarcticus IMCC3135 TaxID=1192854 RepID=A0A2Z2NI86_9GAMM|nr:GTP 3',8-cyclase MoaA [Granulosicoccus antarcticus]ASJ70185.1 Cyclic pyranopterin monophosphate synthase [Granulosicoccus antarcticus IMCC3135]
MSTTQTGDKYGRPLRDLRVSVTDRCNFRCVYCMPKEIFNKDYRFLPRSELLTFEEIEQVVRASAELGVSKIRLTGGEPLVRRDLERLISQIRAVPGITDISMTTNASLLTRARAQSLRDAGLQRLNVSLDAMDDATFMKVNDVDVTVQAVLDGIENAAQVNFESIKINMVVKKGLNDHSILPMAHFFHGSGQILRFIEFMDVGNSNAWDLSHVTSSSEIAEIINAELPIQPAEANYRGEVAKRWEYRDGGGEIGIISSVSEPFCGDCSRARLSATGSLYTCLFASGGHDLRPALREGTPTAVREQLHKLWSVRADRYSETRTQTSVIHMRPKVEMSFIGG